VRRLLRLFCHVSTHRFRTVPAPERCSSPRRRTSLAEARAWRSGAMRGVARAAPPRVAPPLRRCCCRAAAAQAQASDVAALQAWLRARGLPEQEVALQDALPRTGRGLVALRPLPRGAPLLRVPEPLLLTHDRAVQDAPPGLRSALETLPEWSALALFLASQRAALAAGRDVPWGAYVAALPATCGGVLDWPDGEAATLLQGTSVAVAAAERLASVSAAIDDILSAAPHAGVTPAGLRWAFAVLFSRLVRLPARGDSLAVVPWADMANQATSATAHLDWDESLRSVVLRPERAYAAGEQIFASYGQRSSGQLLLSYGFAPAVDEGPGGAHESVSLLLELPSHDDATSTALKAAALAALGLPATQRFDLRAGGGMPPELLPWATFAAASFADEASARAAAAAACAPPQPQQQGWRPFSSAAPATAALPSTPAARELVLGAIRTALAALDAADAAPPPLKRPANKRAAAAKAEPPDAGRVAAAAAIRGVERRILQRTDFVLRAELRQLRT
jgi:hypothetical protein